jgi:hypothetical protein
VHSHLHLQHLTAHQLESISQCLGWDWLLLWDRTTCRQTISVFSLLDPCLSVLPVPAINHIVGGNLESALTLMCHAW